MTFKRIITLISLGFLAILMIRSVQAADQKGAEVTKEVAKAVSKYAFTIDPAKILYPIAHPIETFKAVKSFIETNPKSALCYTLALIIIPSAYNWWSYGQLENTSQLIKALNHDLYGSNTNSEAALKYAQHCNMLPFINRFDIVAAVTDFYETTSPTARESILRTRIAPKTMY